LGYDDLDRLEVLTVVRGHLVNETPLCVGVGREAPLGSPVDLPLLRVRFADGRSSPVIPGSSLKGVLRSLAEAIARASGYDVHGPWDFRRAEEEAKEGRFCIICGIFGSTELASHVRVYDAYPVNGGQALTFTKTGVGINRDFRGAQPGVLYTEELVVPGVRWSFRMDVINIRVFPEPGDERGRILRQVIELLSKGFVQIGARKTVGYGLLRLEEARYEVYEVRNGLLEKTSEGGVV
jgi:CRISPR-associated RAMP protein (TIGR02581 family)